MTPSTRLAAPESVAVICPRADLRLSPPPKSLPNVDATTKPESPPFGTPPWQGSQRGQSQPPRACLEGWLWPARLSDQAIAMATGHPSLFGAVTQPGLGVPRCCLGSTCEPGWQPNHHQLPVRGNVWRRARLGNHTSSNTTTHCHCHEQI